MLKTPKYLQLLANGQLESKIHKLNKMLENCVLCPHQCQVNRLSGEPGYCKTLKKVVVSGADPHFGEEPELVGRYGSGTIFFSHCNLKCVFCQNYEISHCGEGQEITNQQLAEVMLSLQKKGCHNINLVSPGHIIPQIVESIFIAAQKGLNIPIIYNTNGYDLTDSLKLLDGVVDIYMPDIKFADNDLAMKYLGVKSYFTIAQAAIKEMYRQVGSLKTNEKNIAYEGLLIRHLVMPENLAGTEKIMKFIADDLSKNTYVNIMPQYYPAYKAFDYTELNKRVTKDKFCDALKTAERAGLTNIRGIF
ncbi:radical SAM protein [Alkaliphilus transvaalensis]|uniref:radical SAM protein n=1 Tax=Alkaliphilus transvaalensis TaxID=114628 RepID=UPI001FA6BFCA|nr:radical SAM protein [Alkaliphilus transvaalensis]